MIDLNMPIYFGECGKIKTPFNYCFFPVLNDELSELIFNL